MNNDMNNDEGSGRQATELSAVDPLDDGVEHTEFEDETRRQGRRS